MLLGTVSLFKPHVGSGHICTASGLMGSPRLCGGEGRVVQSQVSIRAAPLASAVPLASGQGGCWRVSSGASEQNSSSGSACRALMQHRDAGWAGREPGTWGVNSKVCGTAGVDFGEAEPDEAEEVSSGRAEVWAWREIRVCG